LIDMAVLLYYGLNIHYGSFNYLMAK